MKLILSIEIFFKDKRSLSAILDIFTESADETMTQTGQALHKSVDSVAGATKAKINAGKDIINAEIALGAALPRFGAKIFDKVLHGGAQVTFFSSRIYHILS